MSQSKTFINKTDFAKKLMSTHLTAEELVDRGLSKDRDGNEQGTIEDFTEAIQLDPNCANAFKRRGDARFENHDQRAIADYSQAIELDPSYITAYFNRGLVFNSLFDNRSAIEDFSTVILLDPNYSDAYHHRGLARFESGDSQGAIEDFSKAISFTSYKTNTCAIKSMNYVYRGSARLDLGDKQGAIEDTQTAADLCLSEGRMEAYQIALDRIEKIQQQ
jgi:tetratricopeptide (TPR) repeat protein